MKPARPAPVAPKSRGQTIREIRERAGLTRHQVAELLEVSYSRITDIETDRKPTTLDMVLKIAEALACDPHSIDARLASSKPARKS